MKQELTVKEKRMVHIQMALMNLTITTAMVWIIGGLLGYDSQVFGRISGTCLIGVWVWYRQMRAWGFPFEKMRSGGIAPMRKKRQKV